MNFIANTFQTFENQVFSRVSGIIALPRKTGAVVSQLTRVATGAIATVGSIATLGYSNSIFIEVKHLSAARDLLPTVYVAAFGIINPSATIRTKNESICTEITRRILERSTLDCVDRYASFLDKQIKSRLFITGYALVATIAKVLDLAIGVIATAASVLSFGYFEGLNMFAATHLKALDVVVLPLIWAAAMVNPSHRLIPDLLFPS